jgi:hypothetical protein
MVTSHLYTYGVWHTTETIHTKNNISRERNNRFCHYYTNLIGGGRFRLTKTVNATACLRQKVCVNANQWRQLLCPPRLIDLWRQAQMPACVNNFMIKKKVHRAWCLDPPPRMPLGATTRPCAAGATTVEPVTPMCAGGVPAAGFGLPMCAAAGSAHSLPDPRPPPLLVLDVKLHINCMSVVWWGWCGVVVVVCGFMCLRVGLRAWVCCVHARAQMGHHNLSERVANSLMATIWKKNYQYGEQYRKLSWYLDHSPTSNFCQPKEANVFTTLKKWKKKEDFFGTGSNG